MNKKIIVFKKMPRFCEKQSIDSSIINKRIEGNMYTAINQLVVYFLTQDDRVNPIPSDISSKEEAVLIQEKIERVYNQIVNIIKFSTTEYELIRTEEQTKRLIKNKIIKGYEPIVNIEKILVYQEDLDFLSTVEGLDNQKLLFAIICYLRFTQTKYSNNNLWCNFEQRLYFKSANIKASLRDQNLIIGNLAKLGYLRPSFQIDKISFYATFMELIEPKTIIKEITDFENLGIEYEMLIGKSYTICPVCGKYVKNPNNEQWVLCGHCKRQEKYKNWRTMKLIQCELCGKPILISNKDHKTTKCEECYSDYRRIQQAEWVSNKRKNNKK